MENSVIETWFPMSIYKVDNLIEQKELDIITETCKEIQKETDRGGDLWLAKNTYNTHGTFDLTEHSLFANVINKVEEHVNNFAKALSSDYKYKCTSSWFNIYNKHDFQEFHVHADNIFSAVLFIKGSEENGKLNFKAPGDYDMYPPKNIIAPSQDNYYLVANTVGYDPEPGRLIIFRSFLPHMVEANRSDKERISLAFNFK